MALIKKQSDRPATTVPPKGATLGATAAAKFEQEPDSGGDTAVVETPAAETPAAEPTPSASRAVATAKPNAGAMVTAPALQLMDVVSGCKDAYAVDWDTLDRVQANNGNFLDLGKNKESMGTEIQLRLLSWQDNWQISPGVAGADAAEHVRYSNDGRVTTKGEDCIEYLTALRTTFKDAKMTQRVVLVGVLEGSAKNSRLEGEMIQLDLSNTSKKEFDKYRLGTAYKIGKNALSAEEALFITLTAEVTSRKDLSWTLVKFEPTKLAA